MPKFCGAIIHFHINTMQGSDGNECSLSSSYLPISLSISILLAKLHKIKSHKCNKEVYLSFRSFFVWKYKNKPRWVGNGKEMRARSYLYGNFPLSEVYFNVISICKQWLEISREILNCTKNHAPNYPKL